MTTSVSAAARNLQPARPDIQSALKQAFDARSVAIVGASRTPGKLGNLVLTYLQGAGYAGRIFPVNPSGGMIEDLKVYSDIKSLPQPVDLALVAVPVEQTLETLRDAHQASVGLIVCLASGFGEAAGEGPRYDAELRAILRDAPYRIIGPNCQGIVVPKNRLMLNFSATLSKVQAGPVSVISQSGALSGMIGDRLKQRGIGINYLVSSGNEVDITAADLIEAMSADPATHIILAYLEQIRDAPRFVSVARALKGNKSLVICKAGRTATGTLAVQSHTGAMAGDDRVVDGVLRELGVVRVRDAAAAIDAVAALSLGKKLRGNRIGIISAAGGFAVETTDLVEGAGFAVPEFSANVQRKIAKVLPFYGATRNPVDLTATVMGRPEFLRDTLNAALSDDGIDALIVVVTFSNEIGFANAVVEAAESTDKPILVCWTAGEEYTPEVIAHLRAKQLPIFDSPARALTGLLALRNQEMVA